MTPQERAYKILEDVPMAKGWTHKTAALIASAIQSAIDEARAAERERWAKWHDDMAAGYRYGADKIVAEWTGPDIPLEDRRANHRDAQEHRVKAGWHDGCARAIRNGDKP